MSVIPKDAEKIANGGKPWWVDAAAGTAAAIVGATAQYKLSSKQANTAHQREVEDLRKAGLNPILSAMGGRGAASAELPTLGQDIQRGMGSALMLKNIRAQNDLLEAQTSKTYAEFTGQSIDNATKAGTQEFSISEARARAMIADLDSQQRREMLPLVLKQARAQILATVASADRARALAELDKLARVGAELDAKFLSRLGEGSPAMKAVLEAIRGLAPVLRSK